MSGDILKHCRTRKRMHEVIDIMDGVSDRLDRKGKPGFVSQDLSAGSRQADKVKGVTKK